MAKIQWKLLATWEEGTHLSALTAESETWYRNLQLILTKQPFQTNGLFISGNYPCLLTSGHGEFFLHPFIIDGPILSFCTFNDNRCPNGMLYLRAERSAIRTAHLNVS
jgi:hypothetical protein